MGTARTGIVTERRTGKQRGRGTNVRLLQVMITDPNDVQTVQLIEQSGEESNPPSGSLVTVFPGAMAAKFAVAAEDGIAPVMAVGGKRIYGIDPTTHQAICEIRLNPDGTITLFNDQVTQTIAPDGTVTVANGAASFVMNPDGSFLFNGTGTTFDHQVNMTEAVINGIAFTSHVHPENDNGGPTGVPQ